MLTWGGDVTKGGVIENPLTDVVVVSGGVPAQNGGLVPYPVG